MPQSITIIADRVNTHDYERVKNVRISDIAAMMGSWRERLTQALANSGRSMRSVSIAAKCSPNYLHSILAEGQEPAIDRLLRIADVMNVSLSWLLYGLEIGRQEEELLRRYALLSDRQRQAILDLAGGPDEPPNQTGH
jgi:transcriptional regulator with XRE-family HTH domain